MPPRPLGGSITSPTFWQMRLKTGSEIASYMFDSNHSDKIQCTGPSSLVDREDRLTSKLLSSGTRRQKTSKCNLFQTVALLKL